MSGILENTETWYKPEFNPDGTEKHVYKEGARYHVISYSNLGQHCSCENCEINKTKDIIVKGTLDELDVLIGDVPEYRIAITDGGERVLQHRVISTHYANGKAVSQSEEWQTIPTVDLRKYRSV